MSRAGELGPPAGFPRCRQCIYFRSGSADICYRCVNEVVEHVSPTACPVCSQALAAGEHCTNRLCRTPGRRISAIHAIAMHSGPLRRSVLQLKYDKVIGWATIFGRMLAGWLDATQPEVDLIVALPTFWRDPPVEGSRPLPHTELVVLAASKEDLLGVWPFDLHDPRLVVQTDPSPQSAGGDWPAKREAAEAKRQVWRLTDPGAFAGKRVLVFDDVCTTGLTLDAMAGFLIEVGGAAKVSAVVLGRVPWGPAAILLPGGAPSG